MLWSISVHYKWWKTCNTNLDQIQIIQQRRIVDVKTVGNQREELIRITDEGFYVCISSILGYFILQIRQNLVGLLNLLFTQFAQRHLLQIELNIDTKNKHLKTIKINIMCRSDQEILTSISIITLFMVVTLKMSETKSCTGFASFEGTFSSTLFKELS